MSAVRGHVRIFWIVLVPAVAQRFPRSGQTDRIYQIQINPRLAKMVRKSTMIIAGRREHDPHW